VYFSLLTQHKFIFFSLLVIKRLFFFSHQRGGAGASPPPLNTPLASGGRMHHWLRTLPVHVDYVCSRVTVNCSVSWLMWACTGTGTGTIQLIASNNSSRLRTFLDDTLKPGFHYPIVDGPSWRETGFHYPSTRAVLTGARFHYPSWRAVNTARQLG